MKQSIFERYVYHYCRTTSKDTRSLKFWKMLTNQHRDIFEAFNSNGRHRSHELVRQFLFVYDDIKTIADNPKTSLMYLNYTKLPESTKVSGHLFTSGNTWQSYSSSRKTIHNHEYLIKNFAKYSMEHLIK